MRYHARCTRVEIIKRDRIIRRDPPSRLPSRFPRNSHEGNTVLRASRLNPARLILPERKFYDAFRARFDLRSVVDLCYRGYTCDDPRMLRHEFRTKDSVVRSTQKLGVSDLHHMEKVMRGGDRQNTVYFCTLRKREKERESTLHPTGAHLDESVHSSSISRLINCESHTYIAHTAPSLSSNFWERNVLHENERDGKILLRPRA